MRSGSNWAATDYHPRSHQSEMFYFNYSLDVARRQFIIQWYMTTVTNDGSKKPTYYLCNDTQSLWVNGDHVINMGSSYKAKKRGKTATVYRGFTDPNSWLDKHHNCGEFWDTNGDYTGIRRWVNCLGTNWASGSFRLDADANGDASFPVSGSFKWYGRRLEFSIRLYVHNDSLRQRYTITYDGNTAQLRQEDKTVSNIPSPQTKVHGINTILSKNIPKANLYHYKFNRWALKKTNSFSYPSGTLTYSAGATYGVNGNNTLYAIWDKTIYDTQINTVDVTTFKNVSFDSWMSQQNSLLNINWSRGSSTNIANAKIPYDTSISLPYDTQLNRVYGHHLYSWTVTNSTNKTKSTVYVPLTNQQQSADTKIDVLGKTVVKPNYIPSTFNVTLLSYPNYTKEEAIRSFKCTYGQKVKADLSYTGQIPPGCEFIGWSVNKLPKPINPGSDLPIKDDSVTFTSTEEANEYYKDTMYLGMTDDEIERTFLYGEDIYLYPVFRFLTSIYIFTDGQWRLALPYINIDGTWHICLGYDYYAEDGKWHI